MITEADVAIVGKVNKTHGINGEMSMTFTDGAVIDEIDVDTCLLFRLDGIFVPFFIDGVRPRGNDSLLISFDGEDSQEQASAFVGLDIYMRKADIPEPDVDNDGGLYAAQLIGFSAYEDNQCLGEIVDINDSTDNPLFIIKRDALPELYVPIVDEFIEDIDIEGRKVTFDLPEGLVDL